MTHGHLSISRTGTAPSGSSGCSRSSTTSWGPSSNIRRAWWRRGTSRRPASTLMRCSRRWQGWSR
uniref:Uncharacterized protein n=1 Tax=Arundo donax TaxID=35708 RepID=A0A0A8YF47_ARUDO